MRSKRFRYPVTSLAGSKPSNIIKLLTLHKAESKYYFKLALSFIVALIFSPLRWIESLLYRQRFIRFQLKEPPVFIIGFNRSGTTLLHNLLCQDPRAGYTTTLHTVFPYCILTQKRWLGPVINMFLPSKRPFDGVSMDVNFPQEEEFALSNLQLHSIYNFFLFPAEFDWFVKNDYDTARLGSRETETWRAEYRRLVIKSLVDTGGERYVSKNPQNIPRVKLLNEMFPGARFIFIYRNPYVVVESMYNFICAIFPGVQLQEVPDSFSRENVARFYATAINHYFRMKEQSPEIQCQEIRFEDFIRDKIGSLEKIYQNSGMKGFEEAVPHFKAYLERNQGASHETADIHPQTVHFVNKYAADLVVRLGYPVRDVAGE